MKGPLVSVVVPLYNYGRFLTSCIRSVMNQTYKNWELIVVDDCSTDSSYKIARRFLGYRVSVHKTKRNGGPYVARNFGIVSSKGEFITILDADDMLTRDSLQVRVAAALKFRVPFIHADAAVVRGNATLADCYRVEKIRLAKDCIGIHGGTPLIARKVFRKFGLFDEDFRSSGDREMWYRLFGQGCRGPMRVEKRYIATCVSYCRYHRRSMTSMKLRNKVFTRKYRRLLVKRCLMRNVEGITSENTKMLKR